MGGKLELRRDYPLAFAAKFISHPCTASSNGLKYLADLSVSASPVLFIFLTVSPGREVREHPNCDGAKSQERPQSPLWGQFWLFYLFKMRLIEMCKTKYIFYILQQV